MNNALETFIVQIGFFTALFIIVYALSTLH